VKRNPGQTKPHRTTFRVARTPDYAALYPGYRAPSGLQAFRSQLELGDGNGQTVREDRGLNRPFEAVL